MPTAPALPEQFGRYRIVRQLGAGGMGAVYLAEDTLLGRQVALKVPHLTGANPAVIERFYREARMAAGVEHPHLCPVYDVGQIDGVHYLTMPFIEGTPLSQKVGADRPWPPRDAIELVRKLAVAIEVMHRRGLIHRDLKPGNVLLRPDGEPVLMDFGLARSFTDQNQRLTGSGVPVGTPAYMSPEQVRGEQAALGPGTDVYSLGVILYELLTGAVPFVGPLHTVFAQILHAAPAPPSAVRPGLGPELDAPCLKALAKNVEDRHGSMAEFAASLSACWGGGEPASASGEASGPSRTRVRCPACGTSRELSPDVDGKNGECPNCGTPLVGARDFQSTLPTQQGPPPAALEAAGPHPAAADTVQKRSLTSPRGRGRLRLAGGAVGVLLAILLAGWLWFSGREGREKDRAGPSSSPTQAALRLLPLADLTVAAGEARKVTVQVKRENCQGPIELRLEGLPEGVRAHPVMIAVGADAGAVELTADPWADPANREVRLLASAAHARAEGRFRVTVQRVAALPKEITNSIGMKLVLIPSGKFTMGSPRDEKDRRDDEEQHEVEITRPFYMGVYEVTQEQYEQVVGKNPAHFTKENGGGPDHPVEMVSWQAAKDFCDRLSALAPERAAKRVYRLPTEAEWEYACRGGAREPAPLPLRQIPFLHAGQLRRQLPLRRRRQGPQAGEDQGRRLLPAERLRPLRHARQRLGVVRRLVRQGLLPE
jgi:hypothetical protein